MAERGSVATNAAELYAEQLPNGRFFLSNIMAHRYPEALTVASCNPAYWVKNLDAMGWESTYLSPWFIKNNPELVQPEVETISRPEEDSDAALVNQYWRCIDPTLCTYVLTHGNRVYIGQRTINDSVAIFLSVDGAASTHIGGAATLMGAKTFVLNDIRKAMATQ